MSDDDQKNPDKVAEQFRKEFIKGEMDREVAMTQLSERRRISSPVCTRGKHSSSQSRHFAGWLITLPAGEVLPVEFAGC